MPKYRKITDKELKGLYKSFVAVLIHKYLSFQALFTILLWYRKAKQNQSHHYHQSALTLSCVQHDQVFTCNIHTHREKIKPHFEWQLPRTYQTTLNKDGCKNKYSFSLQKSCWFFSTISYPTDSILTWSIDYSLRESFLSGVLWHGAVSTFCSCPNHIISSHIFACTDTLELHQDYVRHTSSVLSGIVFCCYCFSI